MKNKLKEFFTIAAGTVGAALYGYIMIVITILILG
jgi:hypothetical protein